MFSAPLSGMKSAENLLDTAASRIGKASGTSAISTSPRTGDIVELSDMTSLVQALTEFEANSKALETEASMAESTLHITG